MNYENIFNNGTSDGTAPKKKKTIKKITPQRLKNIGLFYLKRFESSTDNLRNVLKKRVNAYAKTNPEFNKQEAYQWIEDVLNDFVRLHYLDDTRFAEIKIRSYLSAGKPARYIKIKLREKGISEDIINEILSEQEYSPFDMAMRLAQKKKIGPYRATAEQKKEFRQKDMGTLVRAGFDYDIVCQVLEAEIIADDTDDD